MLAKRPSKGPSAINFSVGSQLLRVAVPSTSLRPVDHSRSVIASEQACAGEHSRGPVKLLVERNYDERGTPQFTKSHTKVQGFFQNGRSKNYFETAICLIRVRSWSRSSGER